MHEDSNIIAWLLSALGALGAALGIGMKWITGKLSEQIEENTKAVQKNTTEVAKIASRFSDHMDKDEELDIKIVESLARLDLKSDSIDSKLERMRENKDE